MISYQRPCKQRGALLRNPREDEADALDEDRGELIEVDEEETPGEIDELLGEETDELEGASTSTTFFRRAGSFN